MGKKALEGIKVNCACSLPCVYTNMIALKERMDSYDCSVDAGATSEDYKVW